MGIIQTIVNKMGYDLVKKTNLKKINFDTEVANKFLYWQRLMNKIEKVDGDIVECGVGRGTTMLIINYLNRNQNRVPRVVWGFDSFEGFPEPTKQDTSKRNPKKGEWNVTSISGILKLLRDSGIDYTYTRKNVILIKGFFNKTLHKYTGKKIALLHLDGDLYQSYKDCLDALYPKVVKGGIIAFDEYVSTADLTDFPGAFQAIKEFLDEKKEKIQRDESGKYYVIKSK